MNKSHCHGCYCDDYNHGLGGAKECWSLKDAKLIKRKRVPLDQPPPWKQKAEMLPDCYRKTGYWFVKPNQEH